MKKITFFILLFTATTIATAQQIYTEGGRTLSSFEYKNSLGKSLNNLQPTSHTYLSLGYRNQLFIEQLNISAGLNYAGYGAIGSDDALGNFMEWEANYVGLKVEMEYQLFKIKKAGFYLKGGTSTAFFVHGTQTLNSRVLNFSNNDDFDNILISNHAGFGFTYPISENLSFYAQYIYVKSADTSKGTEELKFISHNVGFGLLIDISKKNSTDRQVLEKI